MAHKVQMKIEHAMDVGNVDVEFQVRENNELRGTVRISKGSIDWKPKRGAARGVSWKDFEVWMMSDWD